MLLHLILDKYDDPYDNIGMSLMMEHMSPHSVFVFILHFGVCLRNDIYAGSLF